METVEKKIAPFEEHLGAVSKESLGELAKLTGINAKVSMVEEANNKLKTQIATLEEQIQKLTTLPEVKPEPVIPIRRDKAMGALTDTEIAVLEYLSTEGAKTAPEIKQKVQLSREHTARLMKKLYEEGYLERETGKIPFKYSVKKEMENLLKKQESATN
jgi:predicted HTH transcriptional regulator